jgi:two-component system chemotaxis response regulator CheB
VPLAIVLHMPVGYTEAYAQSLDALAQLSVHEAQDAEPLRPGVALLAPAGRHLLLERAPDGQVLARLETRPLDLPHRPSADVLFRSAADCYRDRLLGVVMTGMGNDGLQGAAWIKGVGGLVFTEAEETCVVYGMPRSVVEAGLSDRSVPLHGLARAILEVV